MELWRSEAWKVLSLVLGNPADRSEIWILIGVGFLAMMVVMRFVGKAAGISELGWGRRALALVLGLGAMLAAEIAVNVYVLPSLKSADLKRIAAIGAPIVGALLAGVPLQMAALKARYAQAMTAFVLSMIVAVLLGMGAKAAFLAFKTGDVETNTLLLRQEDTRKFLRDMK